MESSFLATVAIHLHRVLIYAWLLKPSSSSSLRRSLQNQIVKLIEMLHTMTGQCAAHITNSALGFLGWWPNEIVQYLCHDIRVTEAPEALIPESLSDLFSKCGLVLRTRKQ